jgi:hypothetical protein
MLQHQRHTWIARAFVLAACFVSGGAWGAQHAFAEDKPATASAPVAGEVFVVLASEGDGSIDPSLSDIKALKQPPFNGFKSMKILSRAALKLDGDKAASVDLPNGRRLQLSLIERMPDGRAKVQVSINRPNQKDYLPLLQVIASPGEPFFVAGQKYQGGTLVIGVRVGEHAAK